MSDRDQKLEELKKSLYLLYEFEKPSNFPIKYSTGLNLFDHTNGDQQENLIITSPDILPLTKSKPNSSQLRFQRELVQKTVNNTYVYLPENRKFQTFFSCIYYISQKYSMISIFDTFTWQEFEQFITSALNHYGYHAFRTFRFSINKIRHEVDVIARDNHRILFIDAKHWSSKTVNMSTLKKSASNQKLRAQHLIQNRNICGELLQKLKFNRHSKFTSFQIFPIILVSNKAQYFHIEEGVPILSFGQFNEFINNFGQIQSKLDPIEMKSVSFQKKIVI